MDTTHFYHHSEQRMEKLKSTPLFSPKIMRLTLALQFNANLRAYTSPLNEKTIHFTMGITLQPYSAIKLPDIAYKACSIVGYFFLVLCFAEAVEKPQRFPNPNFLPFLKPKFAI